MGRRVQNRGCAGCVVMDFVGERMGGEVEGGKLRRCSGAGETSCYLMAYGGGLVNEALHR